MKLSTLCDWLSRPRRWLMLLAACLLLALLAAVLPATLWLLLAAPALLAAALYAVWKMYRFGSFGTVYMRPPRPADALAETVLVDADLVDEGTRVLAAAQPINAQADLSLRMGSGALLLGAAMTLLSDELPGADASAVRAAVTRLNIRPDRMKAHNPILHREQTEEYTAVTVQDGPGERTYYLAQPADLASLCTAIWEDSVRPMTADDRRRIQDAAAYIAQSGCRVIAYATAEGDERPTFLGLCGFGEHIRVEAASELAALKSMGLTVMLREPEDSAIDMPALRRALDVQDMHARADLYLSTGRSAAYPAALTIRALPEHPLGEPIQRMREQFRRAENTLTSFTRLLALALMWCILAGNAFSAVAVTAMLLCGAWFFGVPEKLAPLHRGTAAVTLAGCLLLRLFLSAAVPNAALPAGTLLCLLLSCALCGKLHIWDQPPQRRQWIPMAAAAAALLLAHGLLFGLPLLPAFLVLLCSAILVLVCALIEK
ncbi:MAG: hypothetical protein IJZ74_04020 [Clostridia bacterium]|nr:hypothetical protein [Clostridia bacterium]